ncbi:MAG: Wzz/FepE/Etk N-terminal domain-containing protein, partial [Rhodoferax sp.]|nr:Wzz/FepE/Etk N-terminal domain-containing protein [Rhodoferax sp.]
MDNNQTSAVPQPPWPDEDEISLLDILQVVVENLRLLVLGPLFIGLLVFGSTYAIAPTFTATIKFIPPNQQGGGAASLLAGLGALGGLSGAIGNIKNPADLYITFLKSRSVTDALIDRFNLLERYQQKFKDDARKVLDGLMRASSGKDGLITLEVDDKDPAFAAELANATVTELGELLKRLAVTEAQQRRVFFDKQLVTAKNNLTKAEQALKSSSVGSATLKSDPRVAIEGLSRLKASITAQETRLGAMRGYLTESAPEFKQAQTELSVLRSQLARAQEQQPGDASGTSDYVSKYRDFKYQEALFELYAKQYEIARVDESREGAVIQVVDPAIPPERKSKPRKAMIAMVATLASGFVLLLFVFMRQALRG